MNNQEFNLRKILAIIFSIFIASSEIPVFADDKNKEQESEIILIEGKHEANGNENLITAGVLGVGGYLLSKKFNKKVKTSVKNNANKNNSRKISSDQDINNIKEQYAKQREKIKNRSRFLQSAIAEELKKVNKDNKQNKYVIFATACRSLISKNRKTSIERALQSKELYDKKKREVTCWDASLAFLYDIYSKYGPTGNEKQFSNMTVGLLSYNIISNLANHVFCYILADNILYLVDPLLGYFIPIDLVELDKKEAIEKIIEFYDIQTNSRVVDGLLGKTYNFIFGRSKKSKAKSPFGKDGVFVSENIFSKENIKLSKAKWISDILFYNYLLENKKVPGDNYFIENCNCKLFG